MSEQQNKLLKLWDKRIDKGLDEKEWALLYQEVIEVVSQCYSCVGLLAKFPEPAENYYTNFFTEIIFIRLEGKDFRLNRSQSLCPLFKNYLLTINGVLDRDWGRYLGDTDNDEVKNNLENKATSSEDKRMESLPEIGLNNKIITTAALVFLEQHEEWVALYLKYHFCQDKDKRITMDKLTKKHGFTSYHYNAKKLGCIQRKKGIVDYISYKKTYLGEWLLGLGIEISAKNRSEIYQAFEILCSESLTY